MLHEKYIPQRTFLACREFTEIGYSDSELVLKEKLNSIEKKMKLNRKFVYHKNRKLIFWLLASCQADEKIYFRQS
jgi:hypothetical protein